MPISVTCACGKSVRAKDELAGRKVRCPGCRGILTIPQPPPAADEEAVELFLADPPPTRPQPRRTPPPLASAVRAAALPAVIPVDEEPDDPPEPPQKRRSKSRKRRSERSGFSVAVHPEIITGILMMVGAAVWFFLGLAANRIFIYPPILFVLGIAAVVRGFTGNG